MWSALHADHAGAKHYAAVFLEDFGPDHEIGDGALVLERDEHHALGGPRPLADKDEAGDMDPATIAAGDCVCTGHHIPAGEVWPEK